MDVKSKDVQRPATGAVWWSEMKGEGKLNSGKNRNSFVIDAQPARWSQK
jgi:hypothetical protein